MQKEEITNKNQFDCLISYLLNIDNIDVQQIRKFLREHWHYNDTEINQLTRPLAFKTSTHLPHTFKDKISIKKLNLNITPLDYLLSLIKNNETYQKFKVSYNRQLHLNLPNREYQFIGRENELEQLDKSLHQRTQVVISGKHAALAAQGGQGKTALAYQYALTNQQNYRAICWLDMRNSNGLADLERFLTTECQIQAYSRYFTDNDKNKKAQYYLTHLQYRFNKPCLFILDDVPAKDGRLPLLVEENNNEQCHFIITTRRTIESKKISLLELQPMTPQDAGELFIERSGLNKILWNDDTLQQLVIDCLGGHPLSIALAAAYAKQQQPLDLSTLIQSINDKGTSNVIGDTILAEYPTELYATFDLSFESLSDESQHLLLVFALFPRISIPWQVLKTCISTIQSDDPQVDKLTKHFNKKSGPNKAVKSLEKHLLVEKDQDTLSLHEAIYDFVQYKWSKYAQLNATTTPIDISFAQAAIRYVSKLIGDDHTDKPLRKQSSKKAKIIALAGLLMPIANIERDIKPHQLRIKLCLDYWFNSFRLQQYVYDSGLQDMILKQIDNLKIYLQKTNQYQDSYKLVLSKIAGHACYANPDGTGKQAKGYFNIALDMTRKLSQRTDKNDQHKQSQFAWYEVFILDHLINVDSKTRSKDERAILLQLDTNFAQPITDLEQKLPQGLKDLGFVPSPCDHNLLLRAAHYWGHRGNQDSFILLQQLIQYKTDKNTLTLIENAKQHYIKALAYRFAALKLFSPNQYQENEFIQSDKWLYIPQWIEQLPPADDLNIINESFTEFYQAVGDTAHQYRGLHFVCILEYCYHLACQSNQHHFGQITACFEAANHMWQNVCYSSIKKQVLRKNKPVKYVIWMCSSQIFEQLLNEFTAGKQLSAWLEIEELTKQKVIRMNKSYEVNYPFAADEQIKHVKAIWEILNQLQNNKGKHLTT